jgi:hypothetical protein
VNEVFDTYLGLLTLGVVLYFVFSRPDVTSSIIHQSSTVGQGFINSLEGRSTGVRLQS